jgi:hypothetical protein
MEDYQYYVSRVAKLSTTTMILEMVGGFVGTGDQIFKGTFGS